MSTTTDLTVLKINYLTQAQYDNAKSQGTLEANEIYMTPVTNPGVEDVQVDGVSVVTDGVADIDMPIVPTKVSQLQNDSGYITGYTETDPTVPSWAKASSKPSYTASEVGAVPTSRTVNGKALSSNITLSASDVSALPSDTSIPSKVSDLQNDAGYITGYTETDPTVPSWAKASSKPTYTASEVGALPDTTSIPSKTSDLTNDSNFVADASYVHTDNNFTTTEKNKLSGIASGAEVNVQSDWNETDSTADAYIANKPDINELKVLVVTLSAFSSLPATFYETAVTADHVCIKAELGTPSAQTGDWTVTTSAGELNISGSISGSTTATLYLAVKA